MKKKLLSILACTSMVLVGGLALTACGGETKAKSMELKDFMEYIERPEVVMDVVGYTSTGKTVLTTNEGTRTFETKQSVLKDRTGSQGKLVAFSLWNKNTVQATEGTTTITSVTEDRTIFRDDMVYYYASTPNEDPTKANEVTKTAHSITMEQLLQLTTDPGHPQNSLESLGNITETYMSQISDTVGEMGEDENGKDIPVLTYGTTLTSETKGSKTTYTFLRKYEDRTEEIKYSYEYNLVFENDAIIELHGKAIIDDKYNGKTESTADVIATNAVEYPTDLNTYTDMTEDVVSEHQKVVAWETLASANVDTFTNSGLTFEFVGNRTYKVTGTASEMTSEQATQFGAPATQESLYAVVKLNWEEGYTVSYTNVGGKNVTVEWDEEDEHGSTLDIVRLVDATHKTFTVTVTDAEGASHTYTFNFEGLENFKTED